MPVLSQELIDQIVEWKKQGYSDDSIMQYLQSQGYSDSDIFTALNQASQRLQPAQGVEKEKKEEPQEEKQVDEVDTEELIEAIIDEKWQEISQDIKKIVEWKSGIESSIARLDERLKSVEQRLESLYKNIISRVTEYDKHIAIVGGELKAMEQAMSSFLPELNKAIQELKSLRTGSKDSSKKTKKSKKK
ncbi:hypothetical protein J7K74_03440 [Candidatus Woesearchaeota archaeon]|nr:hypothetical protein [Candidatus Woesearchaeota archaeon]